jgi:hypothetical protein
MSYTPPSKRQLIAALVNYADGKCRPNGYEDYELTKRKLIWSKPDPNAPLNFGLVGGITDEGMAIVTAIEAVFDSVTMDEKLIKE